MSAWKKILIWLPVLLWMGLIFFMSSQTGLAGPAWISVTGHIVEYGVLAGLFYFAFARTAGVDPFWIIIFTVILATAYGVTDEWHQSFVPGRVPDIMDVLTDFSAATTIAVISGARKAGRSM